MKKKDNNIKNWTFRIKFSGLTSFVMRPGDSGARVFLMNALDQGDQKHQPELRFAMDDVKPSPWKIPFPQDVIDVDPPPPNRKRWLLQFLDLNFLPAPDVTLKQTFEPDSSIDKKLTKFTKIFKDASVINPACFDPAPPVSLVAVRVPLRHGKLKTTKSAFEHLGPGKLRDCDFAPKGPPSHPIGKVQRCATEVELAFKVEEGPLTLVGIPFRSFSSSGIAFEPASNGMDVVVELENRPVGKEKSRLVGAKEMDEDFSLHYNLSLNFNPEDKRIVPIYDPLRLRGEVKSQNCILGRFADDPRA